jgi:hypothetical protein
MSIQTERQHASQVLGELYQDSFFNRYWETIGRFLGRGRLASIWVSAAVVMSANLLLGVTVSALLGETQFTTLNAILINLTWVMYCYFVIPLFLNRNKRLFEFLQLHLVKSLPDQRHTQEFLVWANQWLGRKLPQFFVSIGLGVSTALLAFYGIYPFAKFSLGQVLIYFINFFHAGIWLYSLLALMAFMSKLSKWNLVLYSDDPASSPILLQFSRELRDYIFFFALVSAILLLLVGLIIGALNPTIILTMLVVVWIPMLVLYVLGNQAYAHQIVRGKYQRLEELQSQIMKLSHAENLDRDTIAHIKSLMDYHDRVKASRNSLYSTESFVNLIGSLALPSLGAILSAIDVWQRLFGKP